jgi:hypothetical protein
MATISWKQGATGLWTDAANWIGGVVPGAEDIALFAAGAFNDAAIEAGSTIMVAGVALDGNPTASGVNTFDILGTLDLGGTLSLGVNADVQSSTDGITPNGSGVISGGTIDVTGGGRLFKVGLNAVTVIGAPPANITFNPSTITGGLTSDVATLDIGTPAFAGNQMLTGDTIDIGDATLGATLTIAPGTNLDNPFFSQAAGGGGALVNNGTIIEATGANFDPFQVNLTNAGLLALSGTLTEFAGAFANSGVVDVAGAGLFAIQQTEGATDINAGLLHVQAGSTLSIAYAYAPLDDTGGTIALDAAASFSLGGTMTGGTLIAAGGTIPNSGTLDSVTIEGSLAFGQAAFTGATGFASQMPGVRATATIDSLSLIGAGVLNDVNLNLAMLSVTQPGNIAGNAALTLGASSDLAIQNTDTVQPSMVTAATSLSLDGTIAATANAVMLIGGSLGLSNAGSISVDAGEALSLLTTNGGPIDNAATGTITVAAAGMLSIGEEYFITTPAFTNAGSLELAAGSTLELGVDLSAASFAGYLQSGVTVIFDGTLTGSTAPGNGSITLPAGSVIEFGNNTALVDVTVLDAVPTTVGGTLDHVAWQGLPLVAADNGITVVSNGLSVTDAVGGTGSIVVAGTNAIMNFLSDTTLGNVDITVGSSASSATDTFSLLDGSNAGTGIDSNLTIGIGSTLTLAGTDFYNGLNNIGTLALGGSVLAGLPGDDAANEAANAAADSASAAYLAAGSGPTPMMWPLNGDANNLVPMTGSGPYGTDVLRNMEIAARQETIDAYNDQQAKLLQEAIAYALGKLSETSQSLNPNGNASMNATPQSVDSAASALGSSATPPPDLATANAATIDGPGTISVGDGAMAFLNADIGSGVDLSFAPSMGFYALTDPANVSAQFTNFDTGDAIDLAFLQSDGGSVTYANGQLSIPTADGVYALNVAFAPGEAVADVQLADDSYGGTAVYIELPCFAAGTRIATDAGEVRVEALRVGMRVRLAGGGTRPIIWTGYRRVHCARHPRPRDVHPVRVRAHAFAPGAPQRDLHLSPDHAVFIDGVLIPIRHLINGITIMQEVRHWVTYYHVELDKHDVVLAEGLACESYLDTGNRRAFTNGGTIIGLHPDFALCVWEAEGCAPLVVSGPKFALARQLLAARAAWHSDGSAVFHRCTNFRREIGHRKGLGN